MFSATSRAFKMLFINNSSVVTLQRAFRLRLKFNEKNVPELARICLFFGVNAHQPQPLRHNNTTSEPLDMAQRHD